MIIQKTKTYAIAISAACILGLSFATPLIAGESAKDDQPGVKVTKTITGLPAGLYDVAINSETNRGYVIGFNQTTLLGNYLVLDLKSNKVLQTVNTGSTQIATIAVDSKTNTLYAANADGTLWVIDGKNNQIKHKYTVDNSPGVYINDMALNHKTHKLYITNGAIQIDVVDQNTGVVLNTIPGDNYNFVTVNEKTNTVYVTNYFDSTVTVIDGHTDQIITTVSVGVPYAPDNCYQLPTGCTTIGSGPDEIAVDEETNRIYLANVNDGTFVTIDGNTNTVIKTLHLKDGQYGAAVDPEKNVIYTTNFAESTLSVIDGKTGKVTDTVNTGNGFIPSGCFSDASTCTSFGDGSSGQAVNPNNGEIYVVNTGNYIKDPTATGSIYVLEPTQIERKEN